MASHRKKKRRTATVPIASMGDIAFLLIIFFLLLSEFAKDKDMNIKLPTSQEVKKTENPAVARVAIDEEGTIYVDGVKVNGPQDVEFTVRSLLTNTVADEQRHVQFKCDALLPKETFEPVLKAIAEAGGIIEAVGTKSDRPPIKKQTQAFKKTKQWRQDMIDEKDEVSPDSLMGNFRGRGLITIVIFTVVAHVVVFGATSIGYIKSELLGPETAEMSKEDKVDNAVREATVAIREIAEKYGLSPQDVSDRFAEGGSRANAVSAKSGDNKTPDEKAPTNTEEPPETPDRPKSAIEKQLETVAPPPAAPDLNAKEEEDLF